MKDMSARLKELRTSNGLSQEKLAEQLLVSRQAVSKWENGEAMPDIENMIALAKLYGVSLDKLVGLEADESDACDGENVDAGVSENVDADVSESATNDTNEGGDTNNQDSFEEAETIVEDKNNFHIHINKGGKKVNISFDGFENMGEDFEDLENLDELFEDLDEDDNDLDEGDKDVNINLNLGGINIDDGGINIGNGKIKVGEHGIDIGNGKIKIGSDGIVIGDEGYEKNSPLARILNSIPYPIIATIAFFLLGAFLNAWSVAWILFCTIPVYYSIVECIKKRRSTPFAYPIFAACVFLFIGMQFSIWHPSWVIFLTIPVYYPIAYEVDKFLKGRRK